MTRDQLVEAGVQALRDYWSLPVTSTEPHVRGDVERVLDAVLPLIADAIDQDAEKWRAVGNHAAISGSVSARNLVRSLGSTS